MLALGLHLRGHARAYFVYRERLSIRFTIGGEMTYLTLRELPSLASCSVLLLDETVDRSSAKLGDPAIVACTARLRE